MITTTVRLPQTLRDRLENEVDHSGIPRSEIVRKAIDEHLWRRESSRMSSLRKQSDGDGAAR